MGEIGKTFLITGGMIMLLGLFLILVGKIPGAGKLPGDFLIKRENFTLYFPLATSFLISLVLSLIFIWLNRR